MYEEIGGSAVSREDLIKCIIDRVSFVSPKGVHRVDVIDGVATYTVHDIKILWNDGKVIEINPEEFFCIGNLTWVLQGVVLESVSDRHPDVWNVGFGWVAYDKNGDINVIHPFPLRISIESREILNVICPVSYFQSLQQSWGAKKLYSIRDTLKFVWEMKWEPPIGIVSFVRERLMRLICNSGNYGYAKASIVAHGLAIFEIAEEDRTLLIKNFKSGVQRDYFPTESFYAVAKELSLPEGHIVSEMVTIASEYLVKKKLSGGA